MCKDFSCNGFGTAISSMIAKLSMGKHNQGLYFKGRRYYTTLGGGFVTLIIITIVIAFAISTMTSIFRKEQYLVNYSLKDLDQASAN